MLTALTLLGAGATHAAVADPSTVSPGIAGFIVTFVLALATWLLIRSMVGRLRRLRYSPDPDAEDPTPTETERPTADGIGPKA